MVKGIWMLGRPSVIAPLAASAGLGIGLVFGASAVALSAASASAIRSEITSVACSSSSACLGGTNSGTGAGVSGTSAKGIGVKGTSTSSYGLVGSSKTGAGLGAFGASNSAILATNDSKTTATISAHQSGSAVAISGSAKAGYGVSGTGDTYGVFGAGAAGSSGSGVLGEGLQGGFFEAFGADGLFAQISQTTFPGSAGVEANDYSSPGLGTFGLLGESATGTSAGLFNLDGNTSPVVLMQAGTVNSGDNIMEAQNDNGVQVMSLDDLGNETLSGELITAGKCKTGCIAKLVRSYGPHVSEPTMEDVGTARLVAGSTFVRLDPAFSNVIDEKSDYHVLVTPEGDSNGLFVAERSARGFLVRENRGGRSSLTFSYRIVARPFGAVEPRLPLVAARAAVKHTVRRQLLDPRFATRRSG